MPGEAEKGSQEDRTWNTPGAPSGAVRAWLPRLTGALGGAAAVGVVRETPPGCRHGLPGVERRGSPRENSIADRGAVVRSVCREGVLERTPGRSLDVCWPDHVDESAQSGRNLPVARIIQKEARESWRPVLQHADEVS
jgi:hypothetical protein